LALLAVIALIWATSAARLLAADPSARPNFLIILCDDLGYGDLGCYGHPTIRTPHLDTLAGEGVRFTDCYASAPVCSPSRTGLLTGRTPYRAGIYDWISAGSPVHLRRDEITIAGLLQAAGYATCQVGKWHCNGQFNSKEQPQPGDHGFEHWFSTQNNAAPSHENPTNFVRNGQPAGPQAGFSSDVVAGEAIRWLEGRPDPRPFFLLVCFHEPHEPIASPSDLVQSYSQAQKEGEALYYANVTQMDRAAGKLLAALDRLSLRENTLVFFTSDNGPETLNRYRGGWRSHGSPGPLRGMKLHLYEGGIRVPGILRWPGRAPAGVHSAEPICNVDLLPTLCEAAGVKLPDRKLDGTSLLPALQGRPLQRKTPLYWQYYRAIGEPKVAIRVGDWKLLAHTTGPSLPPGGGVKAGDDELIKAAELTQFELYHLRDDLGEKNNLAAQEPKRVEELSAILRRMYDEVRAEGPGWEFPK
jgi:arylsulfatase A